jgi:hypothetical protein
MNKPKLIAEERVSTAEDLTSIDRMLDNLRRELGLSQAPVVYVRTFANGCPDECRGGEDCHHSQYAQVIRLWEDTLTDGSKVYELHIL